MKKSLSIILIIVLVLSCGCAKKDTAKKTETEIKSSVVDSLNKSDKALLEKLTNQYGEK